MKTKHILQLQIENAIKNQNINQCVQTSFKIFGSQSAAPNLGIVGHRIDMSFQQNFLNNPTPLVGEFSVQFPHVLPSSYLQTLNNDPNYKNFIASNQQFTMLTEALVAHHGPFVFPESIDTSRLLMGGYIPTNFFPKFHTNQLNVDCIISKKLPSGQIIESVFDVKRKPMAVIDRQVADYYNGFIPKPIFSNVHVSTDISSRHVTSSQLNYFLKCQLNETKAFYENNKSAFTYDQYRAIEEAVNESLNAEKEFYNTGEIGHFNKILYNASKFLTNDHMCKILNIPKMFS